MKNYLKLFIFACFITLSYSSISAPNYGEQFEDCHKAELYRIIRAGINNWECIPKDNNTINIMTVTKKGTRNFTISKISDNEEYSISISKHDFALNKNVEESNFEVTLNDNGDVILLNTEN